MSQTKVDAPLSDAPFSVRAFEAPEYLRTRCEQMRREAPDLGLGYKKATLPSPLQERLAAHLRQNLSAFRPEGPSDEIRTSSAHTIPTLVLEDHRFNAEFAEALRPLHEEWAGMPLAVASCYGIRCYQRGTFLYNHVDRTPLFVSSTICVDSALDSPWPLSIVTPDGIETRIQTAPGELIFYEGTRLPHGRPYPLDGDFYAGIFLHYYPVNGIAQSVGS